MIRILLPASVFGQSTYCEPCDPETSLRGTQWDSSNTNRNYDTLAAAQAGAGGDSANKYKVYVRMPCPNGFNSDPNGYALRYCNGFGVWLGTLYKDCDTNPCSAGTISFTSERKIDIAATKATCSDKECTVKCTEGTPNVDKLICFGGNWTPLEASCAAGAATLTVETEAPYEEYDPDMVSDEVKSSGAETEEKTGSSSGMLLVGVGALIVVLAGVGYMYQKKGAAPEKSGSFMTDERKTRSGRRKKGAQE